MRTKRRELFRLGLFLEQYCKDGDEFLNNIVQVRGDETWVSFVNAGTKGQKKAMDAHTFHQTSRKSLNKRCLPES
jgi:hypothetical protein